MLKPCPKSPNCVSTQAEEGSKHFIEPIEYGISREAAIAAMKKVVDGLPRTQLEASSTNYLHYTFKTKIMRFVDDVEFDFGTPGEIHFRSASRLGYSDLGANRKRMEQLREAFASEIEKEE